MDVSDKEKPPVATSLQDLLQAYPPEKRSTFDLSVKTTAMFANAAKVGKVKIIPVEKMREPFGLMELECQETKNEKNLVLGFVACIKCGPTSLFTMAHDFLGKAGFLLRESHLKSLNEEADPNADSSKEMPIVKKRKGGGSFKNHLTKCHPKVEDCEGDTDTKQPAPQKLRFPNRSVPANDAAELERILDTQAMFWLQTHSSMNAADNSYLRLLVERIHAAVLKDPTKKPSTFLCGHSCLSTHITDMSNRLDKAHQSCFENLCLGDERQEQFISCTTDGTSPSGCSFSVIDLSIRTISFENGDPQFSRKLLDLRLLPKKEGNSRKTDHSAKAIVQTIQDSIEKLALPVIDGKMMFPVTTDCAATALLASRMLSSLNFRCTAHRISTCSDDAREICRGLPYYRTQEDLIAGILQASTYSSLLLPKFVSQTREWRGSFNVYDQLVNKYSDISEFAAQNGLAVPNLTFLETMRSACQPIKDCYDRLEHTASLSIEAVIAYARLKSECMRGNEMDIGTRYFLRHLSASLDKKLLPSIPAAVFFAMMCIPDVNIQNYNFSDIADGAGEVNLDKIIKSGLKDFFHSGEFLKYIDDKIMITDEADTILMDLGFMDKPQPKRKKTVAKQGRDDSKHMAEQAAIYGKKWAQFSAVVKRDKIRVKWNAGVDEFSKMVCKYIWQYNDAQFKRMVMRVLCAAPSSSMSEQHFSQVSLQSQNNQSGDHLLARIKVVLNSSMFD